MPVLFITVFSSSSLLFNADLQNDENFLSITARSVNACGVCSVCHQSCPNPSHVEIWINPVHVLHLCG